MGNFEELNDSGEYQQLYQVSLENDTLESLYWRITAAWRLGHLDEAIELSEEVKSKFSHYNHNDKRWYGLFLKRVGTLYGEQGDIKQALIYNQKALDIFSQLDNPLDQAGVLNNLALVHFYRGELQKAIRYLKQGLEIYEEKGTTSVMARPLNNLGEIFLAEKNYSQAEEYFKRGLEYAKKSGNELDLIHSYSNLLNYYVLMGQVEKAQEYLDEISKIADNNDNDSIQVQLLYCKALILKQSARALQKMEAADLFEEIINKSNIHLDITLHSLRHHIDLLLLTLRTSNQQEVLVTITKELETLKSLSLSNNLFPSYIESLILQSKLASMQGELKQAKLILEEGKVVAKENSLQQIVSKIEAEQYNIAEIFAKYQQFLTSNESFANKMKKVEIEDYMKEVLHIFRNSDREK